MYKIRSFPESNYRAIYIGGKTLRQTYDNNKPILDLDYPEFYDVKITNKCDGKCPWCLTGDTLISTDKGKKQIKNIKTDDTVYNINTKNMSVVLNPVEQLYKREYDGDIIEILLENDEILKITPNHSVYVKNKGWVEAKELKEDDEIVYFDSDA